VRRVSALTLLVLGESVLASLGPSVAAPPAFAAFLAAGLMLAWPPPRAGARAGVPDRHKQLQVLPSR